MKELINMIKTRDLIIPNTLLRNYRQLKITEFELVVLIYYLNQNDLSYDPQKISDYYDIPKTEIMEGIASLQEKELIQIELVKQNNRQTEVINLDNLFKRLGLVVVDKKPTEPNTIFTAFEKEFARTLSPLEYEIIHAWQEQKIADELILSALKEAIYNGVRNMRYIDRILNEWQKKGYQKVSDIKKENKPKVEKTLVDYDWLNEKS